MRFRAVVACPDWTSFAVLSGLAFLLFATTSFPPDLVPAHRSTVDGQVDVAHVQDFAYVFNYARRAAARPGVSPYSLEEHRAFLSEWLGPSLHSALCFAYGPAMVLLLAPLFPFATAWAWLLTNVASSWLAAVGTRELGHSAASQRLARLVLLSLNALHCLVLGQTALATTGLIGLAPRLAAAARRGARLAAWSAVASVVALTAKPPLALVAMVALLASGHLRLVATVGAIVLAVQLAAMAWWGPAIVGDYLDLVARYNLVDADPLFRAGFVPGHMTNLRNVLLHLGADDRIAFRVSSAAFAIAVIAPLLAVVVTRRPWSIEQALGWTTLAYLLCAPHLTGTEDLLLAVPLVLVVDERRLPSRLRSAAIVGCVLPQYVGGVTVPFVSLVAPAASWANVTPLVGFGAKLAPAAAMVAMARRRVDSGEMR
jgi:hypothetical protein